ncbi:hypothetical protein [Virgibacillus siamensis]|uniref:hypothetical protein n=1 Tax=Virgibacillus siamensis TaxID=480071 RepID=UPI000986D7C7|nr:hypothetical protein [Virgibacillus siamensis]
MIKKFLSLILAAVILQGCSSPDQSSTSQETFSTLEDAVNEFKASVAKNLVLVKTTDDSHLLLAEDTNGLFYVGGIQQKGDQFIPGKLTARIDLSSGAGGAGVEIDIPDSKKKYYVSVKKNSIINSDKQSYMPLSKNKSFQVLSKKEGEAVVKSYEKIK